MKAQKEMYFKTITTFIIASVFLGCFCQNEEEVDYYVNLLEENIAGAFSDMPVDASEYKPSRSVNRVYGTYDYIVIGAGSAGAVVASRLSEDGTNTVLLLEAGGRESNFSDIPFVWAYLQGLEFNWNYNTTPQTTSCLGMINRTCAYPRGKGLGGSSIINAIMYVRGNREDFNKLNRQGNPGWSYDDVLPLFKKSEKCSIDDGDFGYHGDNGPLNVEYRQPESPLLNAYIQANLELGRKRLDYNGKEQLGLGKTQFNTINGVRDSLGKAFLNPAANRRNLKILTRSLVTKILIGTNNKTAYGVRFSRSDGLFTAYSRKEVILCAGSIGSPQILMLSGIGPKDHLQSLNIPIIQNLNVGNNLQDHICYYGLNFKSNYSEPFRSTEDYVRDYLNGTGLYTIAGNAQGLGFYQTKNARIAGVPDVEIVIVPSNSSGEVIRTAFHYLPETYDSMWNGTDQPGSFAIYVMLLHPKSVGTVRLKSNNPYDFPLIDTNFLSDADGEDIETLYQGIEMALEMVNTDAFKKFNASLFNNSLPACADLEFLSREFWYCQIRRIAMEIFHPIGTCKMGPSPSQGAVVNYQLKVYGINSLRVADCSIFPETLSGHTGAPAVMVGEKVAELIKETVLYELDIMI